MKTKSKVVLDEWFGRIVVWILNISARILGSILRINHTFDQAPKQIVICKFLGMGSIIQATPLIQTLRKNFPQAKIIFVTSGANEVLLKTIVHVDDTWIVDDKSLLSVITTTWNLLRKFWKKKTDLYIDLETYSYYSAAVATLSCARNRLGFYRAERNILMGVHTHMMFFNSRAPIAQSYLQMARLAGCREIVNELYPLPVTNEDRSGCRKKIEPVLNSPLNKYVIINPNASDLRIERRWPADNFVELLQKLMTTFPDHQFLLIGAKNEKDWVDTIHRSLSVPAKEKVINTAGLLTLTELFALMDGAQLVITNDTGPMHISFALKKKTVCLFGPASPSQYGQNSFAYGLYTNIYCSPCVHDFLTPPCKGDNQCMKSIRTEQVVELSTRLLRGENVSTEQYITRNMEFTKINDPGSLGIVDRS